MPSIVVEGGKTWDFGPVYDLLHNLSSPAASLDDVKSPSPKSSDNSRPSATRTESEGLGDFRAIWEYMGVDPKAPPPRVRTPSPSPLPRGNRNIRKAAEPPRMTDATKLDKSKKEVIPEKTTVAFEGHKDYTSDGAIYPPQRSKIVKWQEDAALSNLDDNDTAESEQPVDTTSADEGKTYASMTQKEKREVKKAKKAAREQHWRECAARKGIIEAKFDTLTKKQKKKIAMEYGTLQAKAVSDAEPDRMSKKQTPAKKASAHPGTPEPTAPKTVHRYPLRSGAPLLTNAAKQKHDQAQAPRTPKANGKKNKATTLDQTSPDKPVVIEPKTPQSVPNVKKSDAISQMNVPKTEVRPSQFAITDYDQSPLMKRSQKTTNVPTAHGAGSKSQVLASHAPLVQLSQLQPAGSSLQPMTIPPPASSARALGPPKLAPSPGFTMRRGEERHLHFLLQLINQFPNEMKWLVAPAQMANHNNDAKGIHVFVDASNIFIGFKEYMRNALGLPHGRQVQGLEISFDSLVLLMERRRPVAKRVLVGSYPNLPAFDMAKAVGYETNILEQVYKDKDISKSTKKHIYIRQSTKAAMDALGPDSANPSAGLPSTPAPGGTSNGGTTIAQKWVEQGVDEILHLKMLESVVDAEEPGTMVLATGDAAVAEYSQGFLKMVERALKKGWSVELLAWRDGMNQAYLNRAFRKQWGARFQVTELDAWAGDLVDT